MLSNLLENLLTDPTLRPVNVTQIRPTEELRVYLFNDDQLNNHRIQIIDAVDSFKQLGLPENEFQNPTAHLGEAGTPDGLYACLSNTPKTAITCAGGTSSAYVEFDETDLFDITINNASYVNQTFEQLQMLLEAQQVEMVSMIESENTSIIEPMIFKTKDGYVNLSLRTLDNTYIDPVNGYEEYAYLHRDYAALLENIQSGTAYEVDWGDGTTDSGVVGYGYSFKFLEHDYSTTDEHTVTLTLSHPVSKIELNYVTEVVQYGDMPIVNFVPGNELLEKMPEYLPKYIVDCTEMFMSAYIYNQDISMWDVGHVVYMYDMFSSATVFNQDLSNWCVTNITSEPSGFATAAFQESHRPHWGTCPV